MHWKTKASIQNLISILPSSFPYNTYYWMQRRFGGLKRVNPIRRLEAGVETWRMIQSSGYHPSDKVFLEVGTGRVPTVPLAYWLMGAKHTYTIDLNPYLQTELIIDALKYLSDNLNEVQQLFGTLLDQSRMDCLLDYHSTSPFTIDSFFELCQITYIAPGDAANTEFQSDSIDFHTSYTVFEHIPPEELKRIVIEGNRIVNGSGLFVHCIDYSDHFSHSDKTISAINFLHYSDSAWKRWAGNRYMYMNRLRHDDFLDLLKSAGHRIVLSEPFADTQVPTLLKSNTLQLNERFKDKSEEILAIRHAWVVSQNI